MQPLIIDNPAIVQDCRVYRDTLLSTRDDDIFQECASRIINKIEEELEDEVCVHRISCVDNGIHFSCHTGEEGFLLL